MESIPPPPPSHVLDEARIFSAEQQEKLRSMLTEVQQHGMSIYVATFTFLDGETIESRAERLKHSWCGDTDFGLVLVFERGSNNLTFSAFTHEATPLTVAELQGLFEPANELTASAESPGDKLVLLMEMLLPSLREKALLQQRLQHETFSRDQWVVFATTVAALLLGLAGAMLALRMRRSMRALRPEPAFFPTVSVAPRFGGNFGGGTMAEATFGPPPHASK